MPSPTASSPAVPASATAIAATSNGDIGASEEKAMDAAIQQAQGDKLTLNIKVQLTRMQLTPAATQQCT